MLVFIVPYRIYPTVSVIVSLHVYLHAIDLCFTNVVYITTTVLVILYNTYQPVPSMLFETHQTLINFLLGLKGTTVDCLLP